MFTLIRHALSMRRVQSVFTLLSVVLSSAVALALVLSSMGVQGGLDKSRQRMGADLMVIPAGADVDTDALLFTGAPMNMYMDSSMSDQVAQVDGVARVSAQFYGQTLNESCCSSSQESRLIGYDSSTDWVISPWMDTSLSGGLGAQQIVAGCTMAQDFRNGGFILGHPVELAAELDATGTDLDGSILMDINAVRSFVGGTEELAYLWDEYGDPSTLISCVMVDVADDADIGAVADELSQIGGITVIESSQAVEQVSEQMNSIFAILLGAAVLLLVATLFQLFARFFSLAWDRRGEIALYRALGASRRDISKLILGEVGVLVGGGVVIGIVVGVLLYLVVPQLLASIGTFPYLPPGFLSCVLVGLGVIVLYALIGLLAVAWPLARAGRIDPSSAMQTGDID